VYSFAYGPPGTPTNFGNGCTTLFDLPTTTLVFIGPTSPTGTATLPVQIPSDTSLIGAVLITQAVVAVAGGPLLGVAELTSVSQQILGF
jgi:hypothetical protein